MITQEESQRRREISRKAKLENHRIKVESAILLYKIKGISLKKKTP
jgi:hypothetical protein